MTSQESTSDQNHPNRMWRYQVTANLKDQESTERYLKWLFSGHVKAVCRWAESAEVVHLQTSGETSNRVMSVYWFHSQSDFDRYEREGAPDLRAEGIQLSEALGGILFERELGWAWSIGETE